MTADQDIWTPRLNGADQAEHRHRFADLPNQTLPDGWIEPFLRTIFTKHPGAFRDGLIACVGLPAAEPKRRRTAQ